MPNVGRRRSDVGEQQHDSFIELHKSKSPYAALRCLRMNQLTVLIVLFNHFSIEQKSCSLASIHFAIFLIQPVVWCVHIEFVARRGEHNRCLNNPMTCFLQGGDGDALFVQWIMVDVVCDGTVFGRLRPTEYDLRRRPRR